MYLAMWTVKFYTYILSIYVYIFFQEKIIINKSSVIYLKINKVFRAIGVSISFVKSMVVIHQIWCSSNMLFDKEGGRTCAKDVITVTQLKVL